MSELVTVPQLSLALDVTEKVVDGVMALAGVKDNQLVPGFVGTFVGADGDGTDDDFTLRNGQFLVADVPSRDVEPRSLEFRDGRILRDGKPFVGVNWMLLEIQLVPKRGNPVGTIPSISEPLRKAREALHNGASKTAADALRRAAVVAALNSDDLIERDRDAAAKKVNQLFLKAEKATERTKIRRAPGKASARRSANGDTPRPPIAGYSEKELRSSLSAP